MRIDTSEPALIALFEKGQVGLIRTEFMRKDDVIAGLRAENTALWGEKDALAAEVEHLKTRPTLANQYADYAALAAENERLNDIVNHYYHIPNADTVSYASWSKLSAEYEQVKQAGLMLADTSKAVVKQLKDQVFSVCEQRDALAAENERLKASQLSLEKWIACEQAHFETADNLREKLYQASVQIERLREAGDVLMQCYCAGDLVKEEWKQLPSVALWLAAKEGRDAK